MNAQLVQPQLFTTPGRASVPAECVGQIAKLFRAHSKGAETLPGPDSFPVHPSCFILSELSRLLARGRFALTIMVGFEGWTAR